MPGRKVSPTFLRTAAVPLPLPALSESFRGEKVPPQDSPSVTRGAPSLLPIEIYVFHGA
jgi:hypothetical protein